jgi:hypothetical protein
VSVQVDQIDSIEIFKEVLILSSRSAAQDRYARFQEARYDAALSNLEYRRQALNLLETLTNVDSLFFEPQLERLGEVGDSLSDLVRHFDRVHSIDESDSSSTYKAASWSEYLTHAARIRPDPSVDYAERRRRLWDNLLVIESFSTCRVVIDNSRCEPESEFSVGETVYFLVRYRSGARHSLDWISSREGTRVADGRFFLEARTSPGHRWYAIIARDRGSWTIILKTEDFEIARQSFSVR